MTDQARPMTPGEAMAQAFADHERVHHLIVNPNNVPTECLDDVADRYDRMRHAPDTARLAKAMRYVERVRNEVEGVVWEGPEPEFYDEYAADVVKAYAHVVRGRLDA